MEVQRWEPGGWPAGSSAEAAGPGPRPRALGLALLPGGGCHCSRGLRAASSVDLGAQCSWAQAQAGLVHRVGAQRP